MHHYRTADAIHSDVIKCDIFYGAGPSPPRFYSQPAVIADKTTTGYFDISNAACRFGTHNNAAVTSQHFAVLYDNVLAGLVYAHAVFAYARLKTKAVIVYVKSAVKNFYAVTGINSKAVAVDSVCGILKGCIFHYNVGTVNKMRIPERRVACCKTVEQHI